MKKTLKNLKKIVPILVMVIALLFSLNSTMAYAKVNKKVRAVSPENVADKIIMHGYWLLDDYINGLGDGNPCLFPSGRFEFGMGQYDMAALSTSCMRPNSGPLTIRKTLFIRTLLPSGNFMVSSVVLDHLDGTPDQNALDSAKDLLEDFLVKNNMIVARVGGKSLLLDLSAERNLTIFIGLMHSTIVPLNPIDITPIFSELTR